MDGFGCSIVRGNLASSGCDPVGLYRLLGGLSLGFPWIRDDPTSGQDVLPLGNGG